MKLLKRGWCDQCSALKVSGIPALERQEELGKQKRVGSARAKQSTALSIMDEPQAFRRLQKLAMDKRKSLREVAEAILLTEE